MWRNILAAGLAALALGAAMPAGAMETDGDGITPRQDAMRKINLAGRQVMLTQRMSFAVCMVHAGLSPDRYRRLAAESVEEFQTIMAGLAEGDPGLGLLPESVPEVTDALARAAHGWRGFRPVAERGAEGRLDPETVRDLHDGNPPLMAQMTAAAEAIERHKGQGVIHPDLKAAVRVAARQGMLTQKAAKELCMIHLGIAPEADRAALAETVALFEQSLRDLRRGSAERGIIAAPTYEIDMGVAYLGRLWGTVAPVMHRAAEGGAVTADSLRQIASGIDQLLREADALVVVYDNL